MICYFQNIMKIQEICNVQRGLVKIKRNFGWFTLSLLNSYFKLGYSTECAKEKQIYRYVEKKKKPKYKSIFYRYFNWSQKFFIFAMEKVMSMQKCGPEYLDIHIDKKLKQKHNLYLTYCSELLSYWQ